MKIYVKLSALLLAVILSTSGCATINYSYADSNEPINWREYNDC